MVLPTNVDSSYADDGSDASVKLHQQHHDTVHGAVNALAGGTTGQVWQKTGSADYAAGWTTPGYGGGDYFAAGRYYFGTFTAGGLSGSALTLNRMVLCPFWVPARHAFDRIALQVTSAATTGGVLRFGLYGSGATPGALLVDGGTASSTTTGTKEVVISQTLDAGLWWLAVVSQVAVCSANFHAGAAASTAPPWAGQSAPDGVGSQTMRLESVSGALPSTVSSPLYLGSMLAPALRAA